jgi:hypothetical protein
MEVLFGLLLGELHCGGVADHLWASRTQAEFFNNTIKNP